MKKLFSLLLVTVLSTIILTGCFGEAISPSPQPSGPVTFNLHFADSDLTNLEPEEVTFSSADEIGIKLIQGLIDGPQNENLLHLLPANTTVNSVVYEDYDENGQIVIVDFANSIKDVSFGSSAELLTIYSIVNTLTQIEDVVTVGFLFDGESQETLWGHMDLTETFEYNDNIVGK